MTSSNTENLDVQKQIPASSSKMVSVKKGLVIRLYLLVGFLTFGLVALSGYIYFTQYLVPVSSAPGLTNLLRNQFLFDVPNNNKLQEGQLKGLVASLNDPYTEYLPKAEREDLTNQLNKQYEGIWVVFDFSTPNAIKVSSVLPDSPAKKAEVKEGDILLKVDDIDVKTINNQQVVEKIRGTGGTNVKLLIGRGSEQIEKNITRAKITADILTYKEQGDVGIITLSSFGDNLDAKMQVIANQITANPNIKKLVLDVRNDSGGLLDGAVNVLSYFVKPDTVLLKERDKTSTTELKSFAKTPNLNAYPIAVVMNEYSASASEISAGALHDIRGAKLVGTKSYGKGVVQKIYNLSNGDSVKITIAEWLTPNGTEINKKGLQPDIAVEKGADPLQTAIDKGF